MDIRTLALLQANGSGSRVPRPRGFDPVRRQREDVLRRMSMLLVGVRAVSCPCVCFLFSVALSLIVMAFGRKNVFATCVQDRLVRVGDHAAASRECLSAAR